MPNFALTVDKEAAEKMQMDKDTQEWIELFRETASKLMIATATRGLIHSQAKEVAEMCAEYAGQLVLEISSKEPKMRKLIFENLKKDEFKNLKITGSNEGQHDIFGTLD